MMMMIMVMMVIIKVMNHDGERRVGEQGCSAPGGLINDLLSFQMPRPNNDVDDENDDDDD